MTSNEEHSTHEMVRHLHVRFDQFESRIEKIETRVGSLEKNLATDIAHLEKHESEACLKESAILQQLSVLTTRFDRHAEAEEKDRAEVIKGLRNTIRSVILGAGSIIGTGFMVLWQTGVLT